MAVESTYDTAIGYQAKQVQSTVALLCALEGLLNVLDFVHLTLIDSHVYPDDLVSVSLNVGLNSGSEQGTTDILPNHSPCTDVQMSDFAVAHETLRQADSITGSLQFSVALRSAGALFGELVHYRCVRCEDGVSLLRGLFAR